MDNNTPILAPDIGADNVLRVNTEPKITPPPPAPKSKAWLWWVLGGVFVALVASIVLLRLGKSPAKTNSVVGIKPKATDLNQLFSGALPLAEAKADKVIIHAQLQADSGLVINPSTAPTAPILGQLYVDQTTNQLMYYNGTNQVALGSTTNTTVNNVAGVSTFQGSTGNIKLLGGSGVALSGTKNISIGTDSTVARLNSTGDNQVFTGSHQKFKNTADSTSAFTVQDATGTSLLSVDTVNKTISTASLLPTAAPSTSTGFVQNVVTHPNVFNYHDSQHWMAKGADGFMRIVYFDNTWHDLHFLACTNNDCTTSTDTLVDSYSGGLDEPTLAISPNGSVQIAYVVYTPASPGSTLRYVHCSNADCSSKTTQDLATDADYSTSIAVAADGFARITYDTYDIGGPNRSLNFVQCTNSDCSSKASTTLESNSSSQFYDPSSITMGLDGLPRITDHARGPERIDYIRCVTADCATNVINPAYSAVGSVYYNDIAIGSDGNARIVTQDTNSQEVVFVVCNDSDCATTSSNTIDSNTPGSENSVSLFLDANNNAMIAYDFYVGTSSRVLKYAQCLNNACSTANLLTIDANSGYHSSMVKGPDGFARIASTTPDGNTLKLTRFGNLSGLDIRTPGTNIGSSTSAYDQAYLHGLNVEDTLNSGALITVNQLGTGKLADFKISGTSVASINNDGSVALQNSTNSINAFSILDASGASLFKADTTNNKLVVTNVEANTDATVTTPPVTVLTTVDSGGVGSFDASAMGADGFARIVYYDSTNTALKFAQCTNNDCSTSNITTVDTGNVGLTPSIAMGGDGFPRLSYYDGTNQALKFAQCTNANCSTSNITTVDTGGVGAFTSTAIGLDGFARISYYDITNTALKYAQCTNADCSTSNISTVDTGGVGGFTSMAIGADGFARISYSDGINNTLKYAQCTNADCSTSNITTVDSGNVGLYTAMSLAADGFARISYYDAANTALKFAQCTDASCSTSNISTVDSGNVGSLTSTTLGSDGFARISYVDAGNSTLKFARCTTASCSSSNIITLDGMGTLGFGSNTSIFLGLDTFPRISYYDGTATSLKFARCANADCTSPTGIVISGTNIGSSSNHFANLYTRSISSDYLHLRPTIDDVATFGVQNASGTQVLAVDTSSGQTNLGSANLLSGILLFNDSTSANNVTIAPSALSNSYTLNLPNIGPGNFDICTSANNCGGSSTLQTAYNNSGSPATIQLAGGKDFQIRNTTAGSLFNVDGANNNITLNGVNSGELQTWQTSSNALPVARDAASSVSANGYVYSIGGYLTTTVNYAKLNADGSVGTWAATTALPDTIYLHSSVVANGYVYVLGGRNAGSTALSTVYFAKLNADGTIGSWNTTTALPSARARHASVVSNGYVYVAGGVDVSDSPQSNVYYAKLNADGTIGTWSSTNNLLPNFLCDLTMAAANGYVYTMGGDDFGPSSVVFYAKLGSDGSVGTWNSTTSLPVVSKRLSSAVIDGYVYAIGGGFGGTQAVYYAKLNNDGTIGAWQTAGNSLPDRRSGQATVAVNGYVYAIGGVDAGNIAQATVYYASTARTTIGGSLDLVGLSSQNLSDPGGGGSLTAGNTNVVGTLQVQDQASFAQSLGITGNLTVQGSQVALNSTNTGELEAWKTNANALPGGKNFAFNASVIANGFVYIIGEYSVSSGSVYFAKLNSDGSAGSWTATTSLPAGRTFHTAVAANGYIYLMGGATNGNPEEASVYYAKLNSDGTVGSWNATSSLPDGRFSHTSVVANGYVYVIGGRNFNTYETTIFYAKLNSDGTLGAWQTASNSLPDGRADHTSVVANGYVYVLGGYNSFSNQSTVFYAKLNSDGSVGVWSTANAMPGAPGNHTSVIVDGYVYVLGGNAGGSLRSTIYYSKLNADGSVGVWQTAVNALPVPEYGHTSVATNGYIYVIGGLGNVFSPNVYYASTARISIGGSLDLVGLSSQNLSDPGGGGSLTAGNTNVVGSLQVQDQASFAQNVSITGNLTTQGTQVALNSSNSGELEAWKTNANSLPAGRVDPATIIANGYIYEFGGRSAGGLTAESTVYYAKLNADGSTGAWQTSANPLPKTLWGHSAATANGYVYIMGGISDTCCGTEESAVYYAKLKSDGSTGTWQTSTHPLTVTLWSHASVVANGYLYAIPGDHGNSPYATVYYTKLNGDGSTGAWQTSANAIPSARQDVASAVANGYVYAIGGYNGGAQSSVYYAKLNSDGTTGVWQTNANSLPATDGSTTRQAVILNGYIYLGAGANDGTKYYYAKLNTDGTTGVWHTGATTLPTAIWSDSMISANGYIYHVGGSNGVSSLASVYYASTARITIGGSLDLVGPAAGQLNDVGGVGGNITAADGNFLGSFHVQGSASFTQGIDVEGDLAAHGTVIVRNTTDSANAFQIQNSAGTTTFFGIDTTGNGTVSIQAAASGAINIGSANSLAVVIGKAAGTGTLTVNGNSTFNGHIITANVSGSTTIALNANCGTGCSVSISGNDTSGLITINTGTAAAAGTQATVTFANAFGAAPLITITPVTIPAASTFPQYYYASTTTTFDLKAYTALTSSKTYTFSYHVLQ